MKSYKGAICDYYKVACDLRKKLVEEIREFVRTNGKSNETKTELLLDGAIDEFLSFPTALMLTDRRLDSYSWENIESISFTDDDSPLVFDCEYGSTDSDYILIGDLIDLYETILFVEDDIKDGHLIITDGEVTVNE